MAYCLKNSLLISLLFILFSSCSNTEEKESTILIEKGTINKTSQGAEVMRGLERILKKPIDSIYQPENLIEMRMLINTFKTCELTDSTVRDDQFIVELNHLDSLLINASGSVSKESHNTLIKQCINCHTSYCPGPITRIKKALK